MLSLGLTERTMWRVCALAVVVLTTGCRVQREVSVAEVVERDVRVDSAGVSNRVEYLVRYVSDTVWVMERHYEAVMDSAGCVVRGCDGRPLTYVDYERETRRVTSDASETVSEERDSVVVSADSSVVVAKAEDRRAKAGTDWKIYVIGLIVFLCIIWLLRFIKIR